VQLSSAALIALLAACSSSGESRPLVDAAEPAADAPPPSAWKLAVDRFVERVCFDDCSRDGAGCATRLRAEMAMAREKLGGEEAACIACIDELGAAAATANQPQCMPMGNFDLGKCDYDLARDTNANGYGFDDQDACAGYPRPPSGSAQ
jgi:hypothetical protein